MRKLVGLFATLIVGLGLSFAAAQTVVAEGFNGPQGVLVDAEGSIWVIDSGMGGDGQVTAFFPAAGGEVTANYGVTARVVKVEVDGSQTVMASLPSMVVGQETTGGARLALLDGELYATSGFWIITAGPEAAIDHMGAVVKISDAGVETVADFWALERDQNPDGFIAEAHPYGILAGPDGNLWVADAGANTLIKVNPSSGEMEVVAVFEGVPGPLPNPGRGDAMESDPVPTAVAVGSDGNVYVSYLVGVPFLPGTAKVVQVASDGAVSDYATGLTSLTDLQLGPDGNLYAIQFAEFGEQGPAPMSGALVRVGEGLSSEVVLGGLLFPTGLSFDDAGNAFITVGGVGAPGSGQVVRYDGVASQ